MKIVKHFLRLAHDCRGATAIEYGLILAMIFLVMVGALKAFGAEETSLFNKVSSTSVTAMQGGG